MIGIHTHNMTNVLSLW